MILPNTSRYVTCEYPVAPSAWTCVASIFYFRGPWLPTMTDMQLFSEAESGDQQPLTKNSGSRTKKRLHHYAIVALLPRERLRFA